MEPEPKSESRSEAARKLLTGALAGVAGTVVMSAFMAAAHRAGALGEPPPKKLVRRTINRLGFGTPKRVSLGLVGCAWRALWSRGVGDQLCGMDTEARVDAFSGERSTGPAHVNGPRAPDLRRGAGTRVQIPSDGGRTILRRPCKRFEIHKLFFASTMTAPTSSSDSTSASPFSGPRMKTASSIASA